MLTTILFLLYGVTFNVVVQAIYLLFLLLAKFFHSLWPIILFMSFCISVFSVLIELKVQKRLGENQLFQSYLRHKKQIQVQFSGKVRMVYSLGLIKVFRWGLGFEFLQNLSLAFKVFLFIPAFIFLNEELQKTLKGVSTEPLWGVDPFAIYSVGGIHVLPCLMFVLSVFSGMVYLGKERAPIVKHVAMSLLFLILLYQSKSVLVVYWCCNIVFSTLIMLFIKDAKNYPTEGIDPKPRA